MFEVANRLAGLTAAATSNPLFRMDPSNPVLKTHRHSKFPSRALLLADNELLLGCQSQQTPGLDSVTRRMLSRCVS